MGEEVINNLLTKRVKRKKNDINRNEFVEEYTKKTIRIPQGQKSMLRSKHYGTLVYDLESRKNIHNLLRKSKLKRRFNHEAKNYIELIGSFNFPDGACHHMAMDPKTDQLLAVGTYPPQVRAYTFSEVSMKFQRSIDAEAFRVVALEGIRKFMTLRRDRYIEFHAPYGAYYKVRVPYPGRDMVYHPRTANVLVGCSNTNNLYRFNLEVGTFQKPIRCNSNAEDINCISINPQHDLYVVGTSNGYIECMDYRTRKVANMTQVNHNDDEVTAIVQASNGFDFAVGTSGGLVQLMDLRKSGVVFTKDHHYESPIHSLHYHGHHMISSDERIVKIWDVKDDLGHNLTNIELHARINHVIPYPDSGMIFIGADRPNIKPMLIPDLGPAPKFCSFIDTITEELDSMRKMTVFNDYKFASLEELEDLGLTDLIGTDMLRPSMHGYFMKMDLYKKAMSRLKKPVKKVMTAEKVEAAEKKRAEQKRVSTNKASLDDRFHFGDDDAFAVDPSIAAEKKVRRKQARRATTADLHFTSGRSAKKKKLNDGGSFEFMVRGEDSAEDA